jgi:hypothetical protein
VGKPFDYSTRPSSQRLADLQHETVELERRLSDARASLDRELSQFSAEDPVAGQPGQADLWDAGGDGYGHEAGFETGMYGHYLGEQQAYRHTGVGTEAPPEHDPTEALVNGGRRTAPPRRVPRGLLVAAGAAAVALAVTIGVLTMSGSGASWPASVAAIQRQAAIACQNPDVKAEPSQINFACAKSTRQILWVFALLTSGGNAAFRDAATGRVGLEPITPAQGGQVAWSLNLHQPYDPANPVDSLQVAARAINNIIGGATLTGSHGNPVVQPGLESHPGRCEKYTGSPAVISRQGFPNLCASPVTSPGGQAALVADVFGRWIVGATPQQAQQAAVLFSNARNPGDPRVQAILEQLRTARPSA